MRDMRLTSAFPTYARPYELYAALCLLPALVLTTQSIALAQDTTPSTAADLTTTKVLRSVSWDASLGAVPKSGALIQAEAGFSEAARVSYHHTVAPGLSLGASVGFDYGQWVPNRQPGFSSALKLQGVARYTLWNEPGLRAGLRLNAGTRIDLASNNSGILLGGDLHVAWLLENRLFLGAGASVPIGIFFGNQARLSVPLLVGPVAEFHWAPSWAVTAELKVGADLNTSGTRFASRVLVGVAYRL